MQISTYFKIHISTFDIFNGANRALKAVVQVLNKFEAGQLSTYMYIILGQGRKSGGAHAKGATTSLAPLDILNKS